MKQRFEIIPTKLQGLSILQRYPLMDHRGYLERMFCQEDLKTLVGDKSIVQINHTLTKTKGTVRGLHFQYPPHAEIKIVSCLKGEIFDVAVDIRYNSPTFLQWHGERLSAKNHKTILVPEGFAHGFQLLTPDCEMLYFCTSPYIAQKEDGINALDTRLAISWPLKVVNQSERDQQFLMLMHNFQGVTL